ncbi:MAG: hypothetical protein JXD23_01080 [Spirochaetales bacterium]|nr:hypothetical protein [Spirochaetales bacterium]
MKVVEDENKNGKFDNKEIYSNDFQILPDNKIQIGKITSYLKIEFPKNTTNYPMDSGFLSNGRMLKSTPLWAIDKTSDYFLREYKPILEE